MSHFTSFYVFFVPKSSLNHLALILTPFSNFPLYQATLGLTRPYFNHLPMDFFILILYFFCPISPHSIFFCLEIIPQSSSTHPYTIFQFFFDHILSSISSRWGYDALLSREIIRGDPGYRMLYPPRVANSLPAHPSNWPMCCHSESGNECPTTLPRGLAYPIPFDIGKLNPG